MIYILKKHFFVTNNSYDGIDVINLYLILK